MRKKTLIFTFLLLTIGVPQVGITDAGKVCLFSAISGTITLDGKPVANAKLVRTVNKEKDKTDETTTDENGYFTMPAVFERTVTKFLPMEFVVSQVIYVEYQGESYKLWSGVKREEEENAESRGEPLIVQCELNNEMNLKQVNGSPMFSLCTWAAADDPPKKRKLFDDDEV